MEKIKYIYRAFRYKYLVDAPEINFIQQNLKKGDVAVDIGCHKGGYLYWLQKGVTSEGQVYAFEPQLKLYNYLNSISNTMSYDNVVIENKGLSVRRGRVHFYIPKTKSGTSPGARIDALGNENQRDEKLEIEVVTLDEYFYDRQIFPNFIKIDVEGHEKQVLLGGMNLLKYNHPILMLECENRHLDGESIFDVFQVLLDIGYQGFFYENRELKSISEFELDRHQIVGEGRFWEEKGYVNNFIFKAKSQ